MYKRACLREYGTYYHINLNDRKSVFRLSDHVGLKQECPTNETIAHIKASWVMEIRENI